MERQISLASAVEEGRMFHTPTSSNSSGSLELPQNSSGIRYNYETPADSTGSFEIPQYDPDYPNYSELHSNFPIPHEVPYERGKIFSTKL